MVSAVSVEAPRCVDTMITRSGTEAFGILIVIAPRTPRAPERRYDVDEPLTVPRDELTQCTVLLTQYHGIC